MAVFNADTDVSYALYLTYVKSLSGQARTNFDNKLIKAMCWLATQTGQTLDATRFSGALAWASGQISDARWMGPDSPTQPSTVTAVPASA